MHGLLRFIVYIRKSTRGRTKQILSIEAQKYELEQFIKEHGLNVVSVCIESRSARKSGRPKFAMMIQEIKDGKADAILAWHPNRLSRNSKDSGDLMDLLDQGILKDFKFKNYWFENTPQGKFMLANAFAQAKYETEEMSVGLIRSYETKLRKGDSPGIRSAGYVFDKTLRVFVPDPKRAPFVSRMFSMVGNEKLPVPYVCEVLTAAGFLQKNGKPYSRSSFYNMLHHPVYYGAFFWRKELRLGNHQPLISKEMFDRVQIILGEKKRKKKYRSFLYRGAFRCAHCDCAMTFELKKGRFGYVRCTKKRGQCEQAYVREEALRAKVATSLRAVLLPREWVDFLSSESQKQRQTELERLGAEHDLLTKRFEALQGHLGALVDLLVSNVIGEQEYKPKRAQIIAETIETKEKLVMTERKLQAPLELDRYILTWLNKAIDLQDSPNDEENLSFLKVVGSNLKIADGELSFSFKAPWDIAVELRKQFEKEGVSPFSQDTNLLLCRFLDSARTGLGSPTDYTPCIRDKK